MRDSGSLRQVGGRGIEPPLDFAEYPKIALLWRSGSDHNRQIRLIIQPIVTAIGQIKIDIDMQMPTQKAIKNRDYALAAERDGCLQPDMAGGLLMHLLHKGFGALHFGQHPHTVGIVRLAQLGQRQPPGGALQQPDTEPQLQTGDLPADMGFGQAECACRLTETL